MKFHAREVVLTTDGSVALTYACAAAYALLSLLLLVRYAHNALARNLSAVKPAMLLLLGFVVYCGVRSGTLMYSGAIQHITNTVLVLPTSLYLVLMGCMARLWTLYLRVLRGEADVSGGDASSSGGGAHSPRATAAPPTSSLDNASRCVAIRSPLAAALLGPGASPFHQPRDGATNASADARDTMQPHRSRWNIRRLLYVGVLVVAGACALIILLAGVICITVSGLKTTHCIDVPSAADVVACWACGALLVAIAVQLYHAAPTSRGDLSQHHSHFGDRKGSTSSTAVSIPTMAVAAAAATATSSPSALAANGTGVGAGGGSSSSSDPELDRLNHANGNHCAASLCACCSSPVRAVSTVYRSPHLRTVAAAAIFGVYTVARGCIVALNLVAERDDIPNANEEYVTPGFYVVEWMFLAGCVRLVIGPPQ